MFPRRFTIDRFAGTWSPVARGVRGSLQVRPDGTWIWYCDAGVDVRIDDRVTSEHTGAVVYVDAVRDPAELGHHLEVDCRPYRDEVVVKREGSVVTDSEGNTITPLVPVGAVVGEWLTPSAEELEIAAQAGQRLDALLKVPAAADVRLRDVVVVNGTWSVTSIEPGRTHATAHLVRVEQ